MTGSDPEPRAVPDEEHQLTAEEAIRAARSILARMQEAEAGAATREPAAPRQRERQQQRPS